MICVTLVTTLQTWNFTRTAHRAEGRVIDLRSEEDVETGTAYHAVFEFHDEVGQKHTVSDEGKYNPSPYAIGDPVTVLYLRGQPQSAKINNIWSVWWMTIVCLVIGMAFLLIYFLVHRKTSPRTSAQRDSSE